MIALSGCSVEKNTRLTRAYHNITSHYNVYFNGNESLKSGVERIETSIQDDYTKILPIFKSSEPGTATAATSEMEYAVQKASKLIKLHSITKNPKRKKNRTEAYKKLAAKEEYNNWVDDAYLLMGQAYFYQHNFNSAIENFSYVVRKFGEEDLKYDAYIWLVRSYTMLERYVEASEVITNMSNDAKFPKRLEGELALVTADYHLKQLEYEEAISFLSIAVKKGFNKKDKLRYKYILAQLYKETGKMLLASQTFREVARMNPPYKMAFNARINAAEVFTGEGNVDKLKKELRQMLRDRKNVEFRDQIYFAIANIYKTEGNMELAKDQYIKSAAASSQNMYQRALSCLTLADIYFLEPEYVKSQAYYDSAMVVIDEKYPDYRKIKDRHTDLSRLVENINTVAKEDSLQRIAALSESERNGLIDKWINDAKIAEEKKKKDQEEISKGNSMYRMNMGMGLGRQDQNAGWYFYSPTSVAYGRVEFKQLWGNRKLEDGWRRANKLSRSEVEAEDAGVQKTDTIENVIRVIDPKERDFYVQDLPLNDSLMVLSHGRIRDALFNAGRIFKTVYSNYPRAIESYEDLNERYPDNIYELSAYFELYDLYAKNGDATNSELYKAKIVQKYSESKYAKYLQNPNYFIELEAKNDSLNNLYRKAFGLFKQGNYNGAGAIMDQIVTMSPDTLLLPKIEFIQTVAKGTSSGWPAFEKLLTSYVTKYPKAEPSPLAEEILVLIKDSTLADYQKLVALGYLNDKIQNEELKADSKVATDEFGGKFTYDEELLHYFIIAIPKEAKVDINRLKFDIANYNIDHFTKMDFDIETENLGSNSQLLVVRAMENKENSLIYFRNIIRKREVFKALAGIKYVNFVVSSTNYREITTSKSYSEYLKFFIKNYSRFISGDFKEGLLPDPEELMTKAKTEEEQLQERGTFVMVNTGRKSRIYSVETNVPQNLVVAVNDASFSLRPVMTEFSGFHRKNYKDSGLKILQEQIEGYRMMVIKSLATKAEALDYFTKVVTNRSLFNSLGTRSYRTFLISDGNLTKLIETGTIDNYMGFFSDVYLKNQTEESTGNVTPAAESKPTTNVKPTQTEQKPVVQEPVKPAKPVYEGSYNTNISGAHVFTLIIPQTGVDKAILLTQIARFNATNFANVKLKINEAVFDATRSFVTVEGLNNDQLALRYLNAIIYNTDVFKPLANADYRNFIITTENLKILLEKKDLAPYMIFYKQFYLERKP